MLSAACLSLFVAATSASDAPLGIPGLSDKRAGDGDLLTRVDIPSADNLLQRLGGADPEQHDCPEAPADGLAVTCPIVVGDLVKQLVEKLMGMSEPVAQSFQGGVLESRDDVLRLKAVALESMRLVLLQTDQLRHLTENLRTQKLYCVERIQKVNDTSNFTHKLNEYEQGAQCLHNNLKQESGIWAKEGLLDAAELSSSAIDRDYGTSLSSHLSDGAKLLGESPETYSCAQIFPGFCN